MISMVRPLAVLATAIFAAPAVAQPGPDAPPPAAATEAHAATVVIVSPQPPAIGQPGGPDPMAPAMTAAPQNQDWNNVSHINGQLVKVGEQGDYLYDNGKTTNIATNPIGWMFGFYGVSISHAIHPNMAIRGDVNWFDLAGITGHELGVSVPIYFRRVFQGPFLEVGLVLRNLQDSCFDCGGSEDESIGPEVMFGWHWTFDSGLNVAMAFGAMRNMNHSSTHSIDAEPAGYFRIGYAL